MATFDWSGWTAWTPLFQLDLKIVPSGPGVYAISTGRPLFRVIGEDPEGLLDIGESSSLRQRLRDFARCATKRGQEGHMAGWRYAFFRFDRHFPFETLRVRWRSATTKDEAYEIEGRTMLTYMTRHSELPPLNYSFNWRPFELDGWDLFDRQIGTCE